VLGIYQSLANEKSEEQTNEQDKIHTILGTRYEARGEGEEGAPSLM
jgi:hypothetical protein